LLKELGHGHATIPTGHSVPVKACVVTGVRVTTILKKWAGRGAGRPA
jgi:hypothetical protein